MTNQWTFVMKAIGFVESPYEREDQVPKGPGAKHEAEGVLVINEEYAPGLLDIEGFSHLYVLWVFHRSQGFNLLAHPPTARRPHGVFASRSPKRPNPIGLTVVELLRRDGNRLRIKGVDMLNLTPVLDIKPYLSSVPEPRLRRGWLEEEGTTP